jgi:hypothetical protein
MTKNQVYILTQKIDNKLYLLTNKKGILEFYDTFAEADIERIYLQPDYEEKLVVFKI